MQLFTAGIQGIYQIQRPDGTIDLPRSETQVSSKRAGYLWSILNPLFYHESLWQSMFFHICFIEEYTRLSVYLLGGQVLFNFHEYIYPSGSWGQLPEYSTA